jgi:penicillin amidase
MRAAFATAVAHLSARLGAGPSRWSWGRLHSRQFPSLTQADALGYGPRAAGGDPVDAAPMRRADRLGRGPAAAGRRGSHV